MTRSMNVGWGKSRIFIKRLLIKRLKVFVILSIIYLVFSQAMVSVGTGVNGQDTDGDGSAGLEDATEASDDNPNPSPTYGKYKVYWNVAVNDTANDTKTVNVIATWTDHGIQKRVSIRNIIPST